MTDADFYTQYEREEEEAYYRQAEAIADDVMAEADVAALHLMNAERRLSGQFGESGS